MRTRLVVLLIAAIGLTRRADAQSLHGRVSDSVSGLPLGHTVVVLLDASGADLGITTRADTAGDYRLVVHHPGSYRVKATFIGYEPAISPPLDVASNDVVADLVLHESATTLATVTATSSNDRIGAEFEYRRAMGFGLQFTKRDIEEKGFTKVLDVFHEIPSARVSVSPDASKTVVLLRGGHGSCEPTYYLNGSRFGSAGGSGKALESNDKNVILGPPPVSSHSNSNPLAKDFIFGLTIDQIQAIEVYSGASELPSIYGGSDAACGAIAVWTTPPP